MVAGTITRDRFTGATLYEASGRWPMLIDTFSVAEIIRTGGLSNGPQPGGSRNYSSELVGNIWAMPVVNVSGGTNDLFLILPSVFVSGSTVSWQWAGYSAGVNPSSARCAGFTMYVFSG